MKVSILMGHAEAKGGVRDASGVLSPAKGWGELLAWAAAPQKPTEAMHMWMSAFGTSRH